jgi:hypothetical protein
LEAISIFEELKQPFDLARAYYYYAKSSALKMRESSSFRRDMGSSATNPGGEKGKEYLRKAKEIFKKLGAKGWLLKIKAAFNEPR